MGARFGRVSIPTKTRPFMDAVAAIGWGWSDEKIAMWMGPGWSIDGVQKFREVLRRVSGEAEKPSVQQGSLSAPG